MDVLNYIRQLFNWGGTEQPRKRRANFEYEFPSISPKIRRISHMDLPAGYKKERIIPIKMVDSLSSYRLHHENKPRPPKSWNSTAKENYIEISDDEEDDVRVVEDHRFDDKSREYYEDSKRKPSTIWFDKNHVEVEEDKDDDDDDDVLYVTCIESNESKAKRMGYKFFKSREHESPIILKTIENKSGIYRPVYKKIARPIPRSKYALNESYRLDDKIKYRELLKKVAPHFGSSSQEYSSPTNKRSSSLFGTPLSFSFNSNNRSRSRRLVEAALAQQEKQMQSIDLTDEDITPQFSLFNKFKSDINHKSSPILINGNGEASSSPKHTPKEYTPSSPVTVKDSSDSEIECIGAVSSDNSRQLHRVNSLKATLEMKPVCNPKYIQELTEKYAKVVREKERKIEEEECRKKLHSEHNKKLFGTALEERIKRSLIISEPIEIIEDTAEEAEPFPTFTSDQETLINRALCPGPSGQVLAQKFRMNITRGDLHTLAGLNWLNDEIINFYMNLIMERGNQDGKLKVYATNTFFYPKLMSGGHQSLRRWTRKVDIFAHDIMLVPIHLDVHWCMTVIDFRDKSIRYYDSMGGHLKPCVEALLQYLIDEKMDKKKEKFDISGWVMPVAKDIPQQMNGSDCGVFSCTFAEFASRDAKFTFSQKDMPYLRRKMVYEILTGRLLMG